MCAAGWNTTDVVELLLAHGADVDRKNIKGQTALAIAAEQGRLEVVALLKQAGAKE